MKTFKHMAAQGDILIRKIDKLPDDIKQAKSVNNEYIVAHSETGHNHAVKSHGVEFFEAANDPFIGYLVVNNKAKLEHQRSFDTHEAIALSPGIYEVRRQREYTPKGFRRAAD